MIYKQSGDDSIQWLNSSENLSYQTEETPFHITAHDFKKTILNYLFFKAEINPDEFKRKIIDYILFDDLGSIDKELLKVLTDKFSSKTTSDKVDIENWEEFLICGKDGLFKLVQPSPRRLTDYLNEGKIPFVASGAFNNGIEKYVETKKKEVLDKGNCISVSAIGGFSFYQEKDFIGRGGAGSAIKLLYNENLNEKNALFICSILQIILAKYDYNTMLSGAKLKKEKIYLPVDKDKKPDWKYMEDYAEKVFKDLSKWIEK